MATKEMQQSATPKTTPEGEKMGSMMTTTAAAPARVINSWVPSKRVLRIIKPFVSTVLRSPLHRLLSERLMLLTFTGRKTGKRFTIPVGYTPEGDTLTFFSEYSWYKNLRGGGRRVVVRLQGRERTGLAEVIEDREAVLETTEHLVAKYGLEDAGRKIGLALDIDPPPTKEELAAAMERYVVIRIILDQANGVDPG